jgi:hypothetical protein
MTRSLFAVGLVASILTGCVATPYQPSGMTGGFLTEQVGGSVYRVAFGGNGLTSRETAQTYWLYRCAELTLEKGFDGFEILTPVPLASQMPAVDTQFLKTVGTLMFIPIPSSSSWHPEFVE